MKYLAVKKDINEKENFADNHFHNILRLLMFYQISLSPQAITAYKHGIYELPREFPNNLRLRILGNLETLGKYLKFID